MGGKRWTAEEESIFWREIARRAPSGSVAKGKKREEGLAEKGWHPLVKRMKRRMKEIYPNMKAMRNYTIYSCCMYTERSCQGPLSIVADTNILDEHYFQNYIQGKPSPKAGPYIAEYKAWLQRKQARRGFS